VAAMATTAGASGRSIHRANRRSYRFWDEPKSHPRMGQSPADAAAYVKLDPGGAVRPSAPPILRHSEFRGLGHRERYPYASDAIFLQRIDV